MDQFYNQSAADWARDLVMKMDEAEAREFVTHVTYGVLQEDLASNARTVRSKITEIHKSMLEDATRVVSKGLLSPVDVVAEIAKADWQESGVKRDRYGRFSTVEQRVRSNRRMPAKSKVEERQLGIPSAKALARTAGTRSQKLSGVERSAYQQQFLALADAMDTAVENGGRGVTAVLEDKTTGRRSAIQVNNLKRVEGWNPGRQNLVALRVQGPAGSSVGEASFDLVSSLAHSDAAGRTAQGAVQGVERGGNTFAQRWTEAGELDSSTNSRTYRRLAAGSRLLRDVTPGMPKAQAAAAFGEFVGQYGPEAEKVIGPHARKTAYRYRGIERAPDKALVSSRNEKIRGALPAEAFTSEDRGAAALRNMSPEQKAQISVGVASDYLLNRLPSIQLSEIQRKSGRIPPSEGVIIDRNGKIAVQAVGHADDHYLPFNLKNLNSLRGGEYVRTRTKGGLTTEDIYTGLVSGARQVTVVSNSGVFTMNFEDDFRGVRRYNDKAASMVDRYAKTLDAIKEGQIEREPIDPLVKAEIREEVEREMPRGIWSFKEIEDEVNNRVREYRENPQLSTKELQDIELQAAAAGKNEADTKRIRSQLLDARLEAKQSRFYQLDGQGYAAALESMKEQYPYYVKSVTFAHKREALGPDGSRTAKDGSYPGAVRLSSGKLLPFSPSADQGYVKARHNRPDEVLAGFYDSEIAGAGEVPGTGKTKASHTNYQNWPNNPLRRGSLAPVEAPEETKAAETTTRKKPNQEYAEAKAKVDAERNAREALRSLNTHFKDVGIEEKDYPIIAEARKDFDAVAGDAVKRDKLETELRNLSDNLNNQADENAKKVAQGAQALFTSLKMEAGRLGGVEFNASQHLGQRAEVPYSFGGGPYAAGANPEKVAAEIRGLDDRLGKLGAGNLGSGSDDQTLRDAAYLSGRLYKLIESGKATTEEGSRALAEVAGVLGLDDAHAARILSNLRNDNRAPGETFKEIAIAAEKLRRLNANGIRPDEAKPVAGLTASGPKAAAEELDLDDFIAKKVGQAKESRWHNAIDWEHLQRMFKGEDDYDDDDVANTMKLIIRKSPESEQKELRRMFKDFLNPMDD